MKAVKNKIYKLMKITSTELQREKETFQMIVMFHLLLLPSILWPLTPLKQIISS